MPKNPLETFKFQVMTAKIKTYNCIQEEIWKRLNSGNACYYSLRSNFHISYLKPRSLTLWEEHGSGCLRSGWWGQNFDLRDYK